MKLALITSLFMAFAATALANQEVTLVAKDGKFEPETLEVSKDTKIEILVKNEGSDAEEFESQELHREKIIPPGKSVRIKIGPLKEGTYNFYGDFHQETAKGKIVVK
jgi:plastocyanin